jgi:hypothetical protein
MIPQINGTQQKWLLGVTGSIVASLILASIYTAINVWANQQGIVKDVESNRALIATWSAQGSISRSDIRDLTTRFDAFLEYQKSLLEATNKRLTYIEEYAEKRGRQ